MVVVLVLEKKIAAVASAFGAQSRPLGTSDLVELGKRARGPTVGPLLFEAPFATAQQGD